MIPENFKNHSVFEKLDQLQNALNNENAETSIGIENFIFFKTVHQYIIDKLRITIPILITDAELLNIANEIEAGTSQINTFYGNKNTGHISNAINNFNSALSKVRNLPFAVSKNDFNFSKAISNFQSTIESAYQKLEDNNKEIQAELVKTQQDLSNKNTKLQDFERQLAAKEAEIQNILANYNTEFESIKVNNSNIFETERKRFNEEISLDRKSFKGTTKY